MITKSDVEGALSRIRPSVHETPLVSATRLGKHSGDVHLLLKCESLQRTGSFKARGALNAMMQLADAELTKGVVTVSTGNHAQALSWAAALVGSDCVVVMPDSASAAKIEATRAYGGRVELVSGETMARHSGPPSQRSTPQVQMPYGAKVGLEVTAFRGSRRFGTQP